jgi:1-acyl-sn-glycerol-3-phosphate acyltransferase
MAYWLIKLVFGPVLRRCYRIHVEGLDHVPSEGPAILAGNHLAVCDSVFLPLVLRRRVTFVAKAEYFEKRKTAWFFRAVGQIPVKRGGGPASQRALDAALEVLEGGGLFGIYPEGTRSPDGRLHRGHTGVARLALRSRAPVVAVAMIGTRDAQPIGRRVPRLGSPVTIRISPPMDCSRFHGRADDALVLRRITDEIMWTIRELSGQEYVDRYAKRRDAVEAMGGEPYAA